VKIIVAFLVRLLQGWGSESLGAAESLGGWVSLYCGGRVEEKKSLNLTNFIPNGLRIIQRFTESFRLHNF